MTTCAVTVSCLMQGPDPGLGRMCGHTLVVIVSNGGSIDSRITLISIVVVSR